MKPFGTFDSDGLIKLNINGCNKYKINLLLKKFNYK